MQNINIRDFLIPQKKTLEGPNKQNEFAVLTNAIKTTARKYIKEQEEAATKIQALFRGHLVRKDKKQEATKIQALKNLVRKETSKK